HYATGRNWDFLTGLGVASGPLRLGAELGIAESRQLDAGSIFERLADLLEKALDHVLGLALVQAHALKEQIGELRLRQRHHGTDSLRYLARCAVELSTERSHQLPDGRVDFSIRQCALSILHKHKKRKAFFALADGRAAVDVEHANRRHD